MFHRVAGSAGWGDIRGNMLTAFRKRQDVVTFKWDTRATTIGTAMQEILQNFAPFFRCEDCFCPNEHASLRHIFNRSFSAFIALIISKSPFNISRFPLCASLRSHFYQTSHISLAVTRDTRPDAFFAFCTMRIERFAG